MDATCVAVSFLQNYYTTLSEDLASVEEWYQRDCVPTHGVVQLSKEANGGYETNHRRRVLEERVGFLRTAGEVVVLNYSITQVEGDLFQLVAINSLGDGSFFSHNVLIQTQRNSNDLSILADCWTDLFLPPPPPPPVAAAVSQPAPQPVVQEPVVSPSRDRAPATEPSVHSTEEEVQESAEESTSTAEQPLQVEQHTAEPTAATPAKKSWAAIAGQDSTKKPAPPQPAPAKEDPKKKKGKR